MCTVHWIVYASKVCFTVNIFTVNNIFKISVNFAHKKINNQLKLHVHVI